MSKNYVALKEYTKAKELCLQMLSDENALVADEYVSIDKVWQTLGQIYRKQKAYDKAVQILLQALSYRRSVYGENSRVGYWILSPLDPPLRSMRQTGAISLYRGFALSSLSYPAPRPDSPKFARGPVSMTASSNPVHDLANSLPHS